MSKLSEGTKEGPLTDRLGIVCPFSEITGKHNLWGVKLIVISDDSFHLEYLRYSGLGSIKGGAPTKGLRTIIHVKKFCNFYQIRMFCQRNKIDVIKFIKHFNNGN